MSKQLIDLNAKLYRLGVRVENNRLRQVHPFTMTSFEVMKSEVQDIRDTKNTTEISFTQA